MGRLREAVGSRDKAGRGIRLLFFRPESKEVKQGVRSLARMTSWSTGPQRSFRKAAPWKERLWRDRAKAI